MAPDTILTVKFLIPAQIWAWLHKGGHPNSSHWIRGRCVLIVEVMVEHADDN